MRSYQSAWERNGFQASTGSEGQERWIWQDGIFSVEVTKHPDANQPPAGEGFAALHRRAYPLSGEWEIYAFINNVPDDPENRSQSAYARKTAKTEEKALTTAIRLRHELSTSMAAKLVKLGFTGWRNHWHKAPITVTLKPSKSGGYANINLRMDYLPNDAAIKALTTLNKFVDKMYPDR